MKKYTVHFLDVWGNKEDGYEVNDIYSSCGTIEVEDDATDSAILQALVAAELIEQTDVNRVQITGEDDLYIDYRGKPVIQLMKVTGETQ